MPGNPDDIHASGSAGAPVLRTSRHRYRLKERISVGLGSTVWRARETLTGREVVVKRLEGSNVNDPVARRRLAHEATASDLVSHRNSVPVLDQVFGTHQAALVFPFVAGRTLAERLRSELIPPLDAAAIALDVSDMLAVAHASGVVHRDVKPANILLGEDGRAHLIDFGISRSVKEDPGGPEDKEAIELTASGMAVGTLPYMPPEQLTGVPATAAADVYALGVVLYEMLSGRRPYEGRSPAEQLEMQQQLPPAVQGPAALVGLAMRALDVRPGRRPSAAQFGSTLRGWLHEPFDADHTTTAVPIAAFPLSPRGQVRPARHMNAGVFAVLALILAAIMAGPSALRLMGVTSMPGPAIGLPLADPTAEVGQHQPPIQREGSSATENRDGSVLLGSDQENPDPATERKDRKPGRGNGGGGGDDWRRHNDGGERNDERDD